MSKSTVTRLFVGSLLALVVGIVVAAVGAGLAFASGAFVVAGPDVTGFELARLTGAAILSITIGTLGIVGGAIGQFVAWIGAVINTSRLDDKTWFIVLLVLGLLSFGFIAMLVYVLAGPDGTRSPIDQRAHSGAPA